MRDTLRDSYADGAAGRFSRHFGRWSMIGEQARRELGDGPAFLFESAWAIPHYAGIAVANKAGYLSRRARALRGALPTSVR